MRCVIVISASLFAAFYAAAQAPEPLKASAILPASDERLMFRADPDQAIVYKFGREHPERFTGEVFIPDLDTTIGLPFGPRDPEQAWLTTMRGLRERFNPDIVIGTKSSIVAVRKREHMEWFPDECLSYEAFEAECLRLGRDPKKPRDFFWDPYVDVLGDIKDWKRANVNLDDENVRRLWLDLMERHMLKVGLPVLTLDNTAYSQDAKDYSSWPGRMGTLEELRRRLRPKLHPEFAVVCNIGIGSLIWMKEDDFVLMQRSIDGLMFEIPYRENLRRNQGATVELMQRYRRMLDAGQCVLLIPRYFDVPRSEQNDYADSRAIAAFAMCFREPGDSLFVAWYVHKDNPDWTWWPRQFGKALGPAALDSTEKDGVRLRREFERVNLTVWPAIRKVDVERKK